VLLLPVTLCLFGCGVAGNAGPAGSIPHSNLATPALTATAPTKPSPTLASASADASTWSFGVESIHSPATLTGARVVLAALPRRLAGQPRQLSVDPRDEEFATVTYGDKNSVVVAGGDVAGKPSGQKSKGISANNALSAMFGLSFGCAKGSYRGTAPRPSYSGSGPAVTRKPLTRNVWFSCRIDGAEGDGSFTGNAVGWTSHQTAWLVVGQDKGTTRAIVDALRQASP
jgi:hypothetical protein